MRMQLDDFRELFRRNPYVTIARFVEVKSIDHIELVMNGPVFNRSGDKAYVMNNVAERATHVELPENDELLLSCWPDLKDVLVASDINLPPGEFFLMQDVYQLPDTGSWERGREIEVDSLEEEPPVAIHHQASLHEGTLIDNALINALRRRTSYLKMGDRYVRSRDVEFRVRRRTQRVLIVLDHDDSRKRIAEELSASPRYELQFYVLEKEGVDLAQLDRGEVQHIGIIHHIRAHELRPDVLLFEPHREDQMQKTSTTLMQSKSTIKGGFRFQGIKCGQIDLGLSMDGLDEAIQAFFQKDLSAIQQEGEEEEDDTRKTARLRRISDFRFDPKALSESYLRVTKHLGISAASAQQHLKRNMARASSVVSQMVAQRWLQSVQDAAELAAMDDASKAKAVAEYIAAYPDRVNRVRASLFYEITLQETVKLCRKAYLDAFGTAGETGLEEEESHLRRAVAESLVRTYGPQHQGADLKELISLYQRDYTKLIQRYLVEFMETELKLR